MFSPQHLQPNVVLAPYTTYNIGGPADYFITVTQTEALCQAIQWARNQAMPYFLLGCGANILVRDSGFRGLVIHNRCRTIDFTHDNRVKAASGATIADLIVRTTHKSLSGLEHFVGIPSSVGGALWQNLHFLSPDRTDTVYIEQVFESARILDSSSNMKSVDKDFFQFGYDDSILHHEEIIVLEATFQLQEKPIEEITAVLESNMAWRCSKQPQLWQYGSCGSVFKKIEGVGAGRLIDQAGLKGTQIGQAMISPKHANYIVNLGGAEASDVLALIRLAQETVAEKLGYQLETEIKIIGQDREQPTISFLQKETDGTQSNSKTD